MLFCAVLLAVISPSPSPSPSPAVHEIARVRVVTGSDRALHRLPIPAAILPSPAAYDMAGSTDAALRAVPGYDRGLDNAYMQNYGLNRISIGGAGNDRGAAIVDGVPAQDPFGGQVDWAAYPAFALTRAEIAIGPGSALYGSGAVGGALALRTFGASTVTAPAGFGALTAGSIVQVADVLVGAPLGAGWQAGAWGETSRTSFNALAPAYRAANSTDAVTVTGTTRWTARYAADGLALNLGTLFSTDAQQEGRPNYTFSRSLDQADLLASLTRGATQYTVTAYDRSSQLINQADAFPVSPGKLLYTQSVPDSDNGESLGVTQQIGGVSLLAQVESRIARGYSRQTGPTGALQDLGSGSQATTSEILQGEWSSARVSLVAGARMDTIATAAATLKEGDRDFTSAALSPRAALSYSFGAVVLRAYAGGGLRVPYLNELVRSYRIGAITYAPSLTLDPERSSGAGFGIDLAGTRSRLSLDAQSIYVNDALDFRTISPVLQMRSNVGATRTDGLLASYAWGWRCQNVDAALSAYRTRVSADENPALLGKQVPYVPGFQASAGWTAGRAVQGGVRLSYIGTSYADDINVQPLGSALIGDVFAGVPLGTGSAQVGISNAFDAHYLTSPDRVGPPAAVWIRYASAKRNTPCS